MQLCLYSLRRPYNSPFPRVGSAQSRRSGCASLSGIRPKQNSRFMVYRGAKSKYQSGPNESVKVGQTVSKWANSE